uniref:Uncharacterized protein n=1 Tax=Lepeophtheirus salmonis TaxID=72036 RepID=A0A0K2ULZ8_LEPSM
MRLRIIQVNETGLETQLNVVRTMIKRKK